MPYRILLRRDLSANWNYNDPVLMLGEPGFETDTGRLKIGDGQSQWSSLDYVEGVTGPQGPQGVSGSSGTSGSSGSSGAQGAQGASGSSGTSGKDGNFYGSSGSSGSSGTSGNNGSSGTSGSNGSSGTSGSNGSSGTSGSSGSSGTSGTSGSSGSSGTSGTSGTSGINGATGATGSGGNGPNIKSGYANPTWALVSGTTYETSITFSSYGYTDFPDANYTVTTSYQWLTDSNESFGIYSQTSSGFTLRAYSISGSPTLDFNWTAVQTGDRSANGSSGTSGAQGAQGAQGPSYGNFGISTLSGGTSGFIASPPSDSGKTAAGWISITIGGTGYYIPAWT